MVAAASTALSSAQITDESGEAEGPPPAASGPSPATQQPVPDVAVGVANGSHTAEHSGGEAAETPASPTVADTATPAAAPDADHAPASVAEPAQPAKPAPYAFSGASSCRHGALCHKRALHPPARLVHVLFCLGGDRAASICCIAAGMQCVLDKASAPVCALAFGRLDSALLAFGANDGVVRIAGINEQKASILHVR